MRVAVARVLGPHGLKGALRLKSFMDNPMDVFKFGKLYTDLHRVVNLEMLHTVKDTFVVKITGVNSRSDAEDFGKQVLYVDKSELPEPSHDEYYFDDLVGLNVTDTDGKQLGQVQNIEDYGAGAFITIRLHHSPAVATVAFRKEFVHSVDIEAKKIVVEVGSLIETTEGS